MTTELIDDVLMDQIVEYALGFCPDYPGRVDWQDLMDRIEAVFDLDLGTSMIGPRVNQIKVAVRQARKEAAQ